MAENINIVYIHFFLKPGRSICCNIFSLSMYLTSFATCSEISVSNMKVFGGNISVFCRLFIIGQTGRKPCNNKIYLSRFWPFFILYNNDWLDISHRIFVVSPGLHCNTPTFLHSLTTLHPPPLSLSPLISIFIGKKATTNS